MTLMRILITNSFLVLVSFKRGAVMKKILVMGVLLIMCLASLTACGKKKATNPVVEDAQLGVQLEDKARDVTGQQEEQAEEADKMLDKTGE